MHRSSPSPRLRALAALLLTILTCAATVAQTPKGRPDSTLPPPPLTYRGLVPGVSTVEELRAKLGEPLHANRWYAYKLIYPAPGRPGHFDSFHLHSRDGKTGTLGNIEAASVPDGWESWNAVRAKLGEPEYFLELSRHSLADYSEKGLRFTFDAKLRTIGVAYVPHGKARVHSGARRFVSLRHLRQGAIDGPKTLADARGLHVGAFDIDITPKSAEWLGPAAKRGEFSIRDALEARCAVITRGDLSVAIVGADLFGMAKSEIDPIESALREHGIDHLLVAMSHNHAAADTIGVYGHFPVEYVAYIQKQIEKGVVEAKRRSKPVKSWRAASDELPLDGARVQGLIRNARNPGLIHPQISVMQAIGEDDRPIATFVHFACHPEGIEAGILETTADFPGYLCRSLRHEIGGGVIFLNGALGGMVSGDTIARTHAEAKVAGERFAAEVKRLLGFAVAPREMAFDIKRYRLELPLTNPKFILLIKALGRRSLHRGRIVTDMFYMRLGEAEIMTIPGELLPEIAVEILERMTGYPRIITGLTNDQLGYLIPGFDFDPEVYEEGMSVGPAGGVMVREQALRMIESERDPWRFSGKGR